MTLFHAIIVSNLFGKCYPMTIILAKKKHTLCLSFFVFKKEGGLLVIMYLKIEVYHSVGMKI